MMIAAEASVMSDDMAPAASALKVESPAKPPAAMMQHPRPLVSHISLKSQLVHGLLTRRRLERTAPIMLAWTTRMSPLDRATMLICISLASGPNSKHASYNQFDSISKS